MASCVADVRWAGAVGPWSSRRTDVDAGRVATDSRDPGGRSVVATRSWWSDGVPLLAVCGAGLAGGGTAHLFGAAAAGDLLWAATAVAAGVPAIWWVVQSLRRRQPGVDVIAVLALAGTLLVSEYLAGAVIAVMLASGRALEARAGARATRDLHALLAHSPWRTLSPVTC